MSDSPTHAMAGSTAAGSIPPRIAAARVRVSKAAVGDLPGGLRGERPLQLPRRAASTSSFIAFALALALATSTAFTTSVALVALVALAVLAALATCAPPPSPL